MNVTGSYNSLIFKNPNELFSKFYDAGSVSATLVTNALSTIRISAIPAVDYSNFKEHVFFNSAELKTTAAINKILNYYPIGISGAPTNSLTTTDVANVNNFIYNLNGFEKFVLNYIGGITGNTKINLNPTITAAATGVSGQVIPLIVIPRYTNNNLSGYQASLTANLLGLALSFDAGLNTIYLDSGTADHNVVFTSDSIAYDSSNIIPLTAYEHVTRSSLLKDLLPDAFFLDDTNRVLEQYISVIGSIFDDFKIYIDELANITHISYDDYHRVPNGIYQQLLAKHFGFELIDTMLRTDISKYIRQESNVPQLYKVTQRIWNRILNNLIYILKKKGTPESVNALIRSYGLPDNYITINDYSFHPEPELQQKIQYKNVNVLNNPVSGYAMFSPSNSANYFFLNSNNNTFTLEARVGISGSNYNLISTSGVIFSAGDTSKGYYLNYANGIFNFRLGTSGGTDAVVSTPAASASVVQAAMSSGLVSVFAINNAINNNSQRMFPRHVTCEHCVPSFMVTFAGRPEVVTEIGDPPVVTSDNAVPEGMAKFQPFKQIVGNRDPVAGALTRSDCRTRYKPAPGIPT